MVRWGYSPSVRLFEAAACGVPIVSDYWCGLETFFIPGEEIYIAHTSTEVIELLNDVPEKERRAVATKALRRVLAAHTAAHRAAELEVIIENAREASPATLEEIIT
jgi:spore maturation protein CgeB